ncbi:hypothetical protein FV139_08295 [Parahaliea maris]|uniref:Uncharacterized protein n=1 Tax=Parahaliea maris TaxID=2716870 RepID=A0A5C9A6Y8_9GAMM|nr:hypothetical protein [Parahaliea maris]TXS95849.1 hypothetical protein FV139_08295 [Parahaliea maris]
MKTLIIILGLGLAIYFVFKRRNPGEGGVKGKRKQRKPLTIRSFYRATSIIHDENACAAVRPIGNRPILDAEIIMPTLPLPDCDRSEQCNCHYEHHDDRRQASEDRRHPASMQTDLHASLGHEERRTKKRGRRREDLV